MLDSVLLLVCMCVVYVAASCGSNAAAFLSISDLVCMQCGGAE